MRIGAFTTFFDELEWVEAIAPQLDCFDHALLLQDPRPMRSWWAEGEFAHRAGADLLTRGRSLAEKHNFQYVARHMGEGAMGLGRRRLLAARLLLEAGCDAVAWFAPDELFTISDIETMISIAAPFSIVTPRAYTAYWRNLEWQLRDWWVSPVICPVGFDFLERDGGPAKLCGYAQVDADVMLHHFVAARPAEHMLQKWYESDHSDPASTKPNLQAWEAWRPGLPTGPATAHQVPLANNGTLPVELQIRLKDILPRLLPTP